MAQTLVINGVSYAYPETADTDWGDVATAWAAAVSTSLLQKTGGTFTLSAEVDFGASFGLKSTYFKSRATNPAAAGVIRLGNTELISWRNFANGADLSLTVDASNNLSFNGSTIGGVIPIILGGTGQTTKAPAFNALSPMTTLGDTIYGGASGTGTRLAGNTTAVKLYYTQTGTGAVSAVPAWAAIAAADISGLTNSNLSGSAGITGANIAANTVATGNIAANAVTNAKMAQMATLTIKGNNTVGTADPLDLTSSQVKGILTPGTATAKTSNYTATAADYYIPCDSSGGTWTLTLPTPVGIAGTSYLLKKVDSSFIQVSITGTGLTSEKLSTLNESVEVYSNGTNWIPRRTIPAVWTSYTPTCSFTNTTAAAWWMRVGGNCHFRVTLTCTGTPGAATLTVNFPSTMPVADTSLGVALNDSPLGICSYIDNGVDQFFGTVRLNTTSQFKFIAPATQSGANPVYLDVPTVTQAIPFTWGNTDYANIEIHNVPITGWNG